ncbi:DEAD/DEAH box helicase [Nafulsella turpanensis]|uniref:DEAD/DEAH box helicase n=1 Tax=Nafulsella turpanensis TaxID=1265690 RepID=UPI0003479736|nr:DEAD/DEAH box helicase [Nafulsella turpanensis]
MKFEDYAISPQIKKSLDKMGFKRPTDIQYKAIPPILKGEDVLAIAQTGTGKTAAFAIPVLHLLHERKKFQRKEGIKCLVMVPTRELAIQITEVFEQLGRHTRVNTMCVVGGMDQEPQIAQLEKGIDILVATPGRMFDLVSQGFIRLNKVEILVLDEADHMLEKGFLMDIRQLIAQLPRHRQTLFISATIDEKIKELAYSLVRRAIRIQISPKDRVSKNVDHTVAFIEMDDKRFFLERLVKEKPDSKMLVFVRTKVRAERVAKAMERVDIKSLIIHGGKEQQDRLEVLRQFKDNKEQMLIATDVSARGIDIPNVEYVINYDIPDQPENYVHRVGRTGRGVHKGTAISFCSPEETEMLEAVESFLGKEIRVLEIDKEAYVQTLDLSEEKSTNWKALMKEADQEVKGGKKRKKK